MTRSRRRAATARRGVGGRSLTPKHRTEATTRLRLRSRRSWPRRGPRLQHEDEVARTRTSSRLQLKILRGHRRRRRAPDRAWLAVVSEPVEAQSCVDRRPSCGRRGRSGRDVAHMLELLRRHRGATRAGGTQSRSSERSRRERSAVDGEHGGWLGSPSAHQRARSTVSGSDRGAAVDLGESGWSGTTGRSLIVTEMSGGAARSLRRRTSTIRRGATGRRRMVDSRSVTVRYPWCGRWALGLQRRGGDAGLRARARARAVGEIELIVSRVC